MTLGITILITSYTQASSIFQTIFTASLFVILLHAPSNLVIKLSLIGAGNILILFTIINSNSRFFLKTNFIKTFYWIILCDFFSMAMILMIDSVDVLNLFNHHNLEIKKTNWALYLFFIYIVKIFMIPFSKHDFSDKFSAQKINALTYMAYNCLAALVVLREIFSVAPLKNPIFLTVIFCIFIAYALLILFKEKANYREHNITFSLFSIAALMQAMSLEFFAKSVQLFILLLLPIQFNHLFHQPIENSKTTHSYSIQNTIFKLFKFIARASSNFLGPLYGNFLLLKIPQLIISLFQIPLRFFHNGSIRRSVLFAIFLVITYYYIWES
ncbi:MAG: hypothetical protein KC505_07560 [Myxococcales bacterium]|nr:hypothetical protein [Myxococcales bacterium]USN51576.1 MAG: hypothetical protein H6731_03975 [Myxococcales bacterium]